MLNVGSCPSMPLGIQLCVARQVSVLLGPPFPHLGHLRLGISQVYFSRMPHVHCASGEACPYAPSCGAWVDGAATITVATDAATEAQCTLEGLFWQSAGLEVTCVTSFPCSLDENSPMDHTSTGARKCTLTLCLALCE